MRSALHGRSSHALLAWLGLAVLQPIPLLAATLTVTDFGDSGAAGQLRTLVNQASPGDTIMIPAGTVALALGPAGEDGNAGGDVDIAKDLRIRGAGADSSTILGTVDRVLDVLAGATVIVGDVTVRGGVASGGGGGGGIRNAGTLTLERVTVRNNGGDLQGGGIRNTGTLTVTASTISGNNGPSLGGGLSNAGTATLTNVTISGNAGTFGGGGIDNSGTLVLQNVTVAGNGGHTGSTGKGIANGGTVQLRNTIVAGLVPQCSGGAMVSLGHNLASDASCGLTGPGDLPNTDPKLVPLQMQGGPTAVHGLYSTSPAADAGDSAGCPPTDQRGVSRPQFGTLTLPLCDIGAYELVATFTPDFFTGPGPGGGPNVRGLTSNGRIVANFFAYSAESAGGVFVAAGQLDGAGSAEIVTGAGPGGGPHVRAFRIDGSMPAGVAPILDLFAFDPSFRGGVRVAACNFDGDGRAEIVAAAGPGGGPHVRVFKLNATGQTVAEPASFFAYAAEFGAGVFVACGDVDGDGVPDLVTGADAGGGPHVRAFRLAAGAPGGVVPILDLFAYDASFLGGVRVAAGNVDGSDRASIIAAPGPGGGPHVRMFKLVAGGVEVRELGFVYAMSFTGGVFVGSGHIPGDTRAAIFTAPGAGGGPHIRVFTLSADVSSFFAYEPAFTGGVTVGGP